MSKNPLCKYLVNVWELGEENFFFCLFLDCSPLEMANTTLSTTSLQAWGLERSQPAGSFQWTLMFVPGFPTLEGTGKQPKPLFFPRSKSAFPVSWQSCSQGSAPFGLCSDWGSWWGFSYKIKKKGSWASKVETFGLWIFITYAATLKVTWLLNLGIDAQDSQKPTGFGKNC